MTGPVTLAIRTMQQSVERSDLSGSPRPLRERAAAIRGRLVALSRKPLQPAPDPHVALRAELIAAHAAQVAVLPILLSERMDDPEYRSAMTVDAQLRTILKHVFALPAPQTSDGLAVVGLALAIEVEGWADDRFEHGPTIALAARSILAATGTALPSAFRGYGDEP